MISPRQIRAARAFLGWSQQKLADQAIVSLNALVRLENERVDPRASTVAAIELALRRAGIEFTGGGDDAEGLRIKTVRKERK